jgi:hypothetical protein
VRIVGRKDFVNVAKKNIEREPVNAVFLLAKMCLSTTTRRINGACLQAATSLYRTVQVSTRSTNQAATSDIRNKADILASCLGLSTSDRVTTDD